MTRLKGRCGARGMLMVLALACGLICGPTNRALEAQSGNSQTQNPPPATPQPTQDIPDAPSTVQPPAPKPVLPAPPPDSERSAEPPSISHPTSAQPGAENPPPMPPVKTVPPGSIPRNQVNPAEGLYKFVVSTNSVQIPVTVKDSDGRRVDGLLPQDFTVLENGNVQKLTYFTADPFQLSVAVVLDYGMPDVDVQKVNQTFSALAGVFSPYDEVALYTYSSSVSEVTGFTSNPNRLIAALDELKLARGRNNGPGVAGGGPLGATGPMVNGVPVGAAPIAPVNTPPREAHVLNDAILRAALDLGKRDRTRRKVILVISDGREMGSQARYRDVLRVLESRDIQVKAVVLDTGSLPVYRQIEKFRLPLQGYSDILPKYCYATGGGEVQHELTRNSIEDAYAEIASEARDQYTLGYTAKPTTGSSAYRTIEVRVDRRGLKIAAKDGYYPTPSAR
jgi:VWFA-related protein